MVYSYQGPINIFYEKVVTINLSAPKRLYKSKTLKLKNRCNLLLIGVILKIIRISAHSHICTLNHSHIRTSYFHLLPTPLFKQNIAQKCGTALRYNNGNKNA
jgi:hypothetical protein